MMTALSHLRAALRNTNSDSLHGLTFDTKLLDQETSKLRTWLGDRGTAKPPQDAIFAALHTFYQDQYLRNRRQALLVCFGCIDPVLLGSSRLIEDRERFPKLLGAVDAYIRTPRAYRPCYRGLLNAYFGYDPEKARSAGKRNWEGLRTYLRDRVANTSRLDCCLIGSRRFRQMPICWQTIQAASMAKLCSRSTPTHSSMQGRRSIFMRTLGSSGVSWRDKSKLPPSKMTRISSATFLVCLNCSPNTPSLLTPAWQSFCPGIAFQRRPLFTPVYGTLPSRIGAIPGSN
jgi:hypothetical protein